VTAMKRKHPWHMFYPLLLVIAIGIAWSIYWLFAFNATKQLVAQARTDLAAQGATLTCEREHWGGYPFRIEVTCDQPQLDAKSGGVAHQAQAQRVFAVMMAYNFSHVIAEVEGPTRMDGVELAHAPARLSLKGQTDGGFDASAEVPDASLAGRFTTKLLRAFARRKGDALDLAADAQSVSAQGLTVESAAFNGTTPAAILDAPDPVAAAARSGQAFDITRAEAKMGDITLSATGQLHLDSAERPAGKVTTEVNDIDKFLGLAAPLAGIDAATQSAIASMLSILAKDSSKRRSIDLVAKDGELYFGPFKLMQLQAIRPP
jgi:hypothetical protein